MKFLGVDVGLVKTGLALSHGQLAQPLMVVRESKLERLVDKIARIAKEEVIEAVIIGLPEGKISSFVRDVGLKLKRKNFKVVFWDETLTTQDAQNLAVSAGIPQRKRKKLEDAFAACLLLQSYLDAHQTKTWT